MAQYSNGPSLNNYFGNKCTGQGHNIFQSSHIGHTQKYIKKMFVLISTADTTMVFVMPTWYCIPSSHLQTNTPPCPTVSRENRFDHSDISKSLCTLTRDCGGEVTFNCFSLLPLPPPPPLVKAYLPPMTNIFMRKKKSLLCGQMDQVVILLSLPALLGRYNFVTPQLMHMQYLHFNAFA